MGKGHEKPTPEEAWQDWCRDTGCDPQSTAYWVTFSAGYYSLTDRLATYEAALREIAGEENGAKTNAARNILRLGRSVAPLVEESRRIA